MFILFWSHLHCCLIFFFFFNDTATTEIYTLSLHDALPIAQRLGPGQHPRLQVEGFRQDHRLPRLHTKLQPLVVTRSEEHTSELQSHSDLVCRLLLEKKKKKTQTITTQIPHQISKTRIQCKL